MTARPSPRLAAILVGFAWGAVAAVFVMGVLALVGWAFSIESLKCLLHPDRVAMNPMTAVGMMLAASSLALLIRIPSPHSHRRKVSFACAVAVVVIGILKLLSYALTIPIDVFLFSAKTSNNPMAPNTAGALVLIGFALIFLDVRVKNRYRPTVPLALTTLAIGMLALTGYLYGDIRFYQVGGNNIPMALNTAIGLLLLGLAVLSVRPEFEPIATILSDTAGGVVARRMLPAALVLPLLVGWFCLAGSRRDALQNPFRLTLYSLLTTIIFMFLTWWNARFLLRLDVERRRAERAAAEEHHLLRNLIDNLPDMVFVKDTHHRFLLNNKAHAFIVGAAGPEEMLGKSDLDYFPPEKSQQFRAEERQVVEANLALIDRPQQIVDSAGRRRSLIVTKVPFHDTRGKVIGIVGIAHDITPRKQAEEERDRYFALSADMMGVAGFNGYFTIVNPAFEATLGYTPEEMTSQPWLDFVHPDDRAATIAEGQKLSLGAVTLFFENRYRCKDGSYRWLSWTAVPVVRDQKIYTVARDTTERRRVEEQLRDANRKLEEAIAGERAAQQSLRTAQSTIVQTEKLAGLGQMVAGVAHEINNPLSFVSNNVAVLQRDLRGLLQLIELYAKADPLIDQHDPQLLAQIREAARQMDLSYTLTNIHELLTRSREGLKRIQQIVKDLRDFARLDESDLSEVNLNDGIQSTLTIIHGHAKKHGVTLQTDLGTLPPVLCYPAKINQVVMNLLTNAIDASGPNGTVTIRTQPRDETHVTLEVTDTGTGIDPAIREKIFDPFFTTKPLGQGTGLGLSISYGIVRDHHGKIEVASEVGKGSTFTVTLPISGPKKRNDVGP